LEPANVVEWAALHCRTGYFAAFWWARGAHPTWLSTYRLAQALATRYRLSHWDGLIVAAATLAQCETLYSEAMQHGQVIGTVKVVNPFK
jgi:predicted nucleic acid-binding protein